MHFITVKSFVSTAEILSSTSLIHRPDTPKEESKNFTALFRFFLAFFTTAKGFGNSDVGCCVSDQYIYA
jgi:hypothetical protein